jgi:hypothetical protein
MSAASEAAKINLLELAQRLGAQYRLTKPFQLQTVIELVNKALSQQSGVDAPKSLSRPDENEK